MAGLALALELVETAGPKVLHAAARTSAVSVVGLAAGAAGFAVVFRKGNNAAFCAAALVDARPDAEDDYARWFPAKPQSEKTYIIELRPLFSAFQLKNLLTTTIRSLLVNFLPLLESYMNDDEEDDLESDRVKLDVNMAFKRSGNHALREISMVTVRRVLERIVVYYVSARRAWKLLKDPAKSAVRKASRHVSNWDLMISVSKTAIRAHALGVAASWIVQEVIEVYRGIRIIYLHRHSNSRFAKGNQKELEVLRSFGRKTLGNTVKAGASLSLAAVGAGCGAVLITPSTGTWIGLAAGDFAGAILVSYLLDGWVYRSP